MPIRCSVLVVSCLTACSPAPSPAPDAPAHPPATGPRPSPAAPLEQRLDVRRFRVIERESGPDRYYSIADHPQQPFIEARYRPPFKTTVLGYELDEAVRKSAKKVSWKWRAVTLPNGGDECTDGKGDSAAVVYLTWKRGLKYYTLKYVWSAVSPKGSVCAKKRNPFVAQDTVIVESGGPLATWKSVEIDLQREFRKHFDDDAPAFLGVAIMSDGDQTQSESAADYADFVIEH